MPSIPFIKKKIGRSYLVWFQNSNSYLQLEEPAWFVFRKVTKRYKTAGIVAEFVIRYGLSVEESAIFVKDICSEIDKLNQPDNAQNKIDLVSDEPNNHHFDPFSIHRYLLGANLIEFSFEARFCSI